MTTPSLSPLPNFDSFRLSHFSTYIPTTAGGASFSNFHCVSFSSRSRRRYAFSCYSPFRKNKVISLLFVGPSLCPFSPFCMLVSGLCGIWEMGLLECGVEWGKDSSFWDIFLDLGIWVFFLFAVYGRPSFRLGTWDCHMLLTAPWLRGATLWNVSKRRYSLNANIG